MTAPTETTRRPALDGLRAVAVYLVVAFHAGLSRFQGGFIGVDVFFVLSGYLVTQVLMRDLEQHGGIRLGRFYSRRVRRLLPASLVAITLTAIFYAAVVGPARVAEAVGAFQASFLYVVNWYFIDQATDYFAGDTAQSPVLHLWSLAVEEQFYLLWPLLFGGLVWATSRLGRHRTRVRLVVLAVAAAASAGWALALREAQPERAYFGTDARAYQLLAGALLALAPVIVVRATRWRRLSQIAGPLALVAIVVLAMRLQRLDPIERGIAVTAATLVLIVAVEAEVGGPLRRVLSLRPLVYLGQISYGTYLWHWPVIIIATEVTEVSPRPLAAVTVLVATGLASLSYHLMELPIRTSSRLDDVRWPLVGIGVSMSIVAALVIVPLVEDTDRGDRVTVAAPTDAGFTPIPASVDPVAVFEDRYGETVECVGAAASDCTVVEGSGAHVLLMGDSNAQMWIPAFTAMAQEEDLTLSLAVTSGCLWQRDVYWLSQKIQDRCERNKEDAYERVIPELDPDLIVLINTLETLGGLNPEYRDGPKNAEIRASTTSSIDELLSGDRQLLIVEPMAKPQDQDFNPRACLDEAEWVEDCRFVVDTRTHWLTAQEREIAQNTAEVTVADFGELACPFRPICDPIIDDRVVWWNGNHIATDYSRTLGPEVGAFLREQSLIPA